jgi:hypothetical protein
MTQTLRAKQVEHGPYMPQTLRTKQTEPGLIHATNFENQTNRTWSHT